MRARMWREIFGRKYLTNPKAAVSTTFVSLPTGCQGIPGFPSELPSAAKGIWASLFGSNTKLAFHLSS